MTDDQALFCFMGAAILLLLAVITCIIATAKEETLPRVAFWVFLVFFLLWMAGVAAFCIMTYNGLIDFVF